MYKIIDQRGTGKTNKLMSLVKENNGVLVCTNPEAMRVKAHAYGFDDIDIISDRDYWLDNYNLHKKVFIDELENFIYEYDDNIYGYSLSLED